MNGFYQDPPRLANQYNDDRLLRDYLRRRLPADVLVRVEPDLVNFGQRVIEDIAAWAADAEAHEPRLVQFDPWGRRIDRIELARGWQELDRISAEEGLVAIGYERTYGPWSRVYQFAKLYLFGPSSAIYSCPLAMTDGAARAIEVHGDDELRQGAYRRLTSRDPRTFWTSGQWMTERTGGSDVGRSETIARRDAELYRLYGTKWFTSATTAQMAFTLARIEAEDGRRVPGSRGLSLFYLETRDAAGHLNSIEILRLKDKLGTRALPTAELSLCGTPAKLVGQPGRGVANIAALVNVTRVYNTISAIAGMRRALALARDYTARREAFGRLLAEHPLHVETLARLEVELHGALHLGFHVVELMGRHECGVATADETLILRMLTPIAKLYTAKQCVAVTSEVLELFGGAGYVEDTGLPKLLRDAQVLPIWEGTTNILSLDALRAIEKEDTLHPTLGAIERRILAVQHPLLNGLSDQVHAALVQLRSWLPAATRLGLDAVQTGARQFAVSLARTYIASLLIDHAAWELQTTGDRRGLAVAQRWCAQNLVPLVHADAQHRAASKALAMSIDLVGELETELSEAQREPSPTLSVPGGRR
jgi:alkylation response protein AidB-like acyl-CoA dehydrogenase